MATEMTPQQLADRTSRALAAATAAGRELGVEVGEAVVLYDVFSVIVHLAPAPVVVRVPTVLPSYVTPEELAARQRIELDVVAWLADRGVPVIPPSPLVPREPVLRDGFSMTFWQLVAVDGDAEPDFVRNAELVARLHTEMRDYPGELPFLSAAEPRMVTESLRLLEQRPDLLDPADLERARREWELLEPLVSSRAAFEAAFPGVNLQPIHGDAPIANIIATETGPLYSDFELTTLGPAEWDVAFFGPEVEAAYNAVVRDHGLHMLDERVLRFVDAVGFVRVVACLALVPQLPALAESLKPSIDQWRTVPFAAGLFT
ncbi:phosphotransferase [Nocardia otitidiscaviarum]|uniref:phosphotransferase n=1 Tax=Nocardia otitidiscaviarum TaxID=1823 RepID=UPI0004A72B88|nr:phosphotransferase [Nocardia otitidiscaviarum]MBF6136057.1 phosphotransferase [Nocardia otitidiscaviarum]MBF6483814.1 phosphotransferase [Nocardia otitidiscaviarum]